MLKCLGLAALSMTIGIDVVDAATIYATSPVYAGQSGGSIVTCRVFNAAGIAANITDRALIDNTGASLSLTTSNCLSGPLGPGKTCTFSATSPGNLSFACRLVVGGTNSNLTGIAEILKGGVYSTQALVRAP